MQIKQLNPTSTTGAFQIVMLAACFGLGMSPANTFGQRLLAITGANVETASKTGLIEDATILVRDGKISAIGKDVKIPVSAQLIDARGKTIIPGIVDPYFVVTIGRNVATSAPRTVVFNGRVFTIGGGSPSIATTFAKVADGLDVNKVNWKAALRSGITTFHVVTGGYAQSLVAKPAAPFDQSPAVGIEKTDGLVLVTVTNETKSLDVLRKNLKPASTKSSTRPGSPAAAASPSPTAALWNSVRDGKTPVFVNVNNAASILHVNAIASDFPKVKICLIASGPNVFSALETVGNGRYSVILPPAIDRKPNSADRMNVAKMLSEKDITFALSLSLGQSDFQAQQNTPFFGPAMLIRTGLSRQETLRALTIEPAKLMGMEKEIGSLEVGKQANFLVFGEDPFSATASIEQVYVSGKPVHD